ncbi:hypothetical protein [Peribacillus butanolivorans]|uniref:hypothetical protein n=1 Tax=Peribacillus butanolivorans TaxID=421767 RepID=UPI0036DAE6D6
MQEPQTVEQLSDFVQDYITFSTIIVTTVPRWNTEKRLPHYDLFKVVYLTGLRPTFFINLLC